MQKGQEKGDEQKDDEGEREGKGNYVEEFGLGRNLQISHPPGRLSG